MEQIQFGKGELSKPALELICLFERTISELWCASLCCGKSPRMKALFDEMQKLNPGDIVIELSTIYRGQFRRDGSLCARGIDGIGYLIRQVDEPFWTAKEWAEQDGGTDPIPTQTVTYMRLFDGREMRWENAMFVKLPSLPFRID